MVDSMRVTQKLHDERGTVGVARRAAEKFRQSRGAIISQHKNAETEIVGAAHRAAERFRQSRDTIVPTKC